MYDFTASKGARPVVMGNFAAFSRAVMLYVVSPRRPPGDVGTRVFPFCTHAKELWTGYEGARNGMKPEMAVPDKLR
jgi:hypothetical protein